jgi:uncharacterized protein (TIGR02265 family)
MSETRYVFPQMIEGLFLKGLKSRVNLQLVEKLKTLGINLNGKLLPAYPADAWYKALATTAAQLFPDASIDEGYLLLGLSHVEGYTGTLIGSVLARTFKIVGPNRVLRRADKNFRSGDNYTQTKLTEVAPGHAELWINEVGPNPNYMKGVLLAGLKLTGVKDLVVEVAKYDGHAATFRIRWSEAQPASPAPSSGTS